MARQSAVGRTSPKGTKPKGRPDPGSARYTPPQSKAKKHSPLWVPTAMFTFLVAGIVVIILNYVSLLPGGDAQNSDLILGLALMVGGFVMSTQYR